MSITHSLIILGVALAVCVAALVAGERLTTPHLESWYRGLRKPGFTPPDWVFPVVWPVLFLMMAIAWWRAAVAAGGLWTEAGQPATVAFLVQIAFNVAWSAIFFTLKRVGWALIEVGLFAISIAVCGAIFWRLDPLAGWLMLPYLAWACFAVALNLRIWQLNRGAAAA